MKTYKHLPTGQIFKQGEHAYNNRLFSIEGEVVPLFIAETGKDWEEIEHKQWEITAFTIEGTVCRVIDGLVTLPNYCQYTLEKCLGYRDTKPFPIYSVKRLSDGEEFKIGDHCEMNSNAPAITKITIDGSYCWLHYLSKEPNYREYTWNIINAIKIEKAFTTEDGVDMYKGDKFYYLHPSYGYVMSTAEVNGNIDYNTNSNYAKKFSTVEAFDEYVNMNKKVLSITAIKAAIQLTKNQEKALITLVNIKI